MKRLKDNVQWARFSCPTSSTEVDWQQFERCLLSFSKLHRLDVNTTSSPPAPDWLKKVIVANGQLQRLDISWKGLFFFPVVLDSVITTIARVKDIRIHGLFDDQREHVDVDLCGHGQCSLTKLALNMALQGGRRLHLTIVFGDMVTDNIDPDIYGNVLRFSYYILSLHKTGLRVVAKMNLQNSALAQRVQEFIDDLSHFYYPQMTAKVDADGYRVRVGTVTIHGQ